jgi:hypothetical protein
VALEHALVNVMSGHCKGQDVASAYAALTAAAHSRLTTPDRLLEALARRERVARRPTIQAMIEDLRDGACSVLERGYLHRVERPHGLPRADRQRTSYAMGARTDRDVTYSSYGLVVELDGREIHDNARSWDDDARRDLAELATSDLTTARVTYGLVFREQCATARWIAEILRRQGWRGELVRCPLCPLTPPRRAPSRR